MKRAVAIFAKTPVAGQVKTRLVPALSPELAANLYRCMLLDILHRVRSTDFDTVIFFDGDESFFRAVAPELKRFPQEQAELGKRLEAAFDRLADLGYRQRLAVGSDAPDLPLAFIQEAFQALEQGNDAVFGPAEDGGYYLIGLNGGYGELFRDIPWSGPQVLERSLERAGQCGFRTALLTPWYDIDCHEDLSRPSLLDPDNGAPLTRAFLREYVLRPHVASAL